MTSRLPRHFSFVARPLSSLSLSRVLPLYLAIYRASCRIAQKNPRSREIPAVKSDERERDEFTVTTRYTLVTVGLRYSREPRDPIPFGNTMALSAHRLHSGALIDVFVRMRHDTAHLVTIVRTILFLPCDRDEASVALFASRVIKQAARVNRITFLPLSYLDWYLSG